MDQTEYASLKKCVFRQDMKVEIETILLWEGGPKVGGRTAEVSITHGGQVSRWWSDLDCRRGPESMVWGCVDKEFRNLDCLWSFVSVIEVIQCLKEGMMKTTLSGVLTEDVLSFFKKKLFGLFGLFSGLKRHQRSNFLNQNSVTVIFDSGLLEIRLSEWLIWSFSLVAVSSMFFGLYKLICIPYLNEERPMAALKVGN